MDYSNNYHFSGAQPYQFMGIPPLTPSHSNSAASDDFTTTASPPEVFDQFPSGLPNEQFQNFDNFGQFNPNAFPGPPTPPNPHAGVMPTQQQQSHQQQQQQQQQTHPGTVVHTHASDLLGLPKAELSDEQNRRQGSNSDDDELTPAQSRRKAQNRAAQRAFRERKERHVKDLEAKLADMESMQSRTMTENEELKREMQKIATENEILRATSSMAGNSPGSHGGVPTTTGPMSYNPTDFYTNVLQNHPNKTPSHRVVTSDDGQRLLAAGATWEYIISHDLFKRGLVDVGDVSERLKTQAKCDGQGPVFEERAIREAIEQSVASGSDELL